MTLVHELRLMTTTSSCELAFVFSVFDTGPTGRSRFAPPLGNEDDREARSMIMRFKKGSQVAFQRSALTTLNRPRLSPSPSHACCTLAPAPTAVRESR